MNTLEINNVRTAVFIDGANNQAAINQLGRIKIDWKKLREYFIYNTKQCQFYYYTATLPQEEDQPIRKVLDWLSFNGYRVVTKLAKSFKRHDRDGEEYTFYKGNMDVELCVDIIRLVQNQAIEQLVLFTGDGDFSYLVNHVQSYGINVIAVSVKEVVGNDLRRQVNAYIPLDQLLYEVQGYTGAEEG